MKRVFPVQVSSGSAPAACEVLTQPPNLRAKRLLCQWTTGPISVLGKTVATGATCRCRASFSTQERSHCNLKGWLCPSGALADETC